MLWSVLLVLILVWFACFGLGLYCMVCFVFVLVNTWRFVWL